FETKELIGAYFEDLSQFNDRRSRWKVGHSFVTGDCSLRRIDEFGELSLSETPRLTSVDETFSEVGAGGDLLGHLRMQSKSCETQNFLLDERGCGQCIRF